MKITLEELSKCPQKIPVIVHSIDMVGYQATAVINGQEHLLIGKNARPLRFLNLMQMREALTPMPVDTLTLRHQSAYDEMVNQPLRQQANTLEVSLSLDPYPFASEKKK